MGSAADLKNSICTDEPGMRCDFKTRLTYFLPPYVPLPYPLA